MCESPPLNPSQNHRCKWAIGDVRKNVIKRTRADLNTHKDLVRKYEPKEVLTTVSFTKKRDWLKDETQLVRELEKKARSKRAENLKEQGENNTTVRETYDAVLSGCLEVLKTSTFDLRRPAQDVREDPVKMERLWGKELKAERRAKGLTDASASSQEE